MRKAALFGSIVSVLAWPEVMSAHRLDEYLQASRLSIAANEIRLEIDLTPGVDVAPLIFSSINTDRDGRISDREGRAFARQVLGDLHLALDGERHRPTLVGQTFPSFDEMRAGVGTIRLEARVAVRRIGGGTHSIVYRNDHNTELGVYLVNALVPASRTIEIMSQWRDERQREFRVDFRVDGSSAAVSGAGAVPELPLHDAGLALAVLAIAVVGVAAARPRRLWSRVVFLILATAGALLLTGVSPAQACSCMSPGPACQAFWKTDAVFDATVVKIDPIARDRLVGPRTFQVVENLVTLNVRQSWKGVDPGVVEVVTSGTGASCGYDFKIGRRYLVFATGGGGDGRLNVSLCSFTREFDGTGESADFLASLGAPETGGRVFGSIQANYRSFEPRGDGMTRVPIELEVRLTGDGRTVSTKTSGGRYSFARLPAGAYEVEVVMPDGYSTWRSTQPAEIPSARACAEVDFYLAPAGRIAGMLVSKTGAAVSEVEVQVTGAGTPLHQSYLPFVSARSDARGHFEVRDLPPGRYVIGINLRDLPNQWTAYPRIMYPGGDEPPSVIDLSLGQAADLGQWLLPPPLAGIKLPGVITWRDGTPAAGVYVSLWDVSPYPNDGLRGAGGGTSGPDGRFVVEAREGRRYRFVARVGGTGPALMLAAPQIEASPGLAPLRLVIQSDPR